MTFSKMLATFRRDEEGAVTVDWVVLTAACVGLGIAVLGAISGATESATTNISDHLEKTDVTSGFGTSTSETDTTNDG